MQIKITTGYSVQLAEKYILATSPVYSVSTQLTKQYKWIDNKPTDKVVGYKAFFIQEGLDEPLVIKFEKEINLPPFLSVVEFDNLQACEVRNKVYFKADGLKLKGGR